MRLRPRPSVAGLWLVLAAGLAFGALSLAIARRGSGYSFGGSSVYAAAAELIAGYLLLVIGVIAWSRGQRRVGAILAAMSLAWFVVEWNSPAAGSALVFTTGLLFYASAPPLVAHVAVAYPDGRLRSQVARVALAVAYAGAILLLGVLPAAAFDPAREGCSQCARNLILVEGNATVTEALTRAGVLLGLLWSVLLVVVAIRGLVRSPPARRRLAVPVVVAACAYLSFVAAAFAHSLSRGFLGTDPVDRALWLAQAAALVALAVAVAASWVRIRRTRAALARLVVELAETHRPGGLRAVLATTLHDPSLEIAYPLDDGRMVDCSGHAVRLDGEITPLMRGDTKVAVLSHAPGVLQDPMLVDDVTNVARLALENERLQAQSQVQLEDLRASRARIIETGDAERRRLERDLHDGAQQRLVSLVLELRLARARIAADRPALLVRIDDAETELKAALADLRDLAHGIFPPALAEEGLAAAIEALAERDPRRIELTALPRQRLDDRVEAAGYFVVSEMVSGCGMGQVRMDARRRDGRLLVEVEGDRVPVHIVDIEDRVGALDGFVAVLRRPGGRVTIRAEIPCAS
jgi:signal transduction histidine kinase